ncbi:hypothetical protein F4778DRAFT_720203 [Xylariomycetidae sp. FL2044]|nr:hypothetical protein F4778DRAFT_720203 [Xylariomycetidae sp. FL2044]
MAEQKKKGFWGGLFRSRSTARGNSKSERSQPRRVSEGDVLTRRPQTENLNVETKSSRRRPRRPDPPHDIKGKGKEEPNGYTYDDSSPLSEWPPFGVSSQKELSPTHAEALILRGAPVHKGHKRPIPHAADSYYGLYATTTVDIDDQATDAADQHDSMTQLTTMRFQGSGSPIYPWETLEQPSLAHRWGSRPGTITLSHWVSLASNNPPVVMLRDPGVVARDVDLVHVFQRLKDLELGLEEEEDQLYRLYRRFLRDPDKATSPHTRMDQQITDLIKTLSNLDWIDFTKSKNQVVTKFIYDTGDSNYDQYLKFFYQILLSLELDLRINSHLHSDYAKERLLGQIPPKIQWNIALARRWRHVRVEKYGEEPDQIRLRFKLRKRQVKMLKRFAQMMRWPNLTETLETLKQLDADGSVVHVSSHAMAFFSGLILPGPTFPFLLMNSLIDIDPDKATDELALLTHLHPHCGFQYRNSHTYWTSTSIIGKVLAPTCLEVAGWVGPALPTADLGPSQIARIRARRPRRVVSHQVVTSMSERSDPLGPEAAVYPVAEYELPEYVDTADEHRRHRVRVACLSLTPVTLPTAAGMNEASRGPRVFDAGIQFAIDGVSWPLLLSYDVSFISAWPCARGPHPLWFDYAYRSERVDRVMQIVNWGAAKNKKKQQQPQMQIQNGSGSDSVSGSGSGRTSRESTPAVVGTRDGLDGDSDDDLDEEKVLVIEALGGVRDDEVLARAWCAHWGLNAVVADVGRTW